MKKIGIYGIESVDLYRYNKIFIEKECVLFNEEIELFLFCEEKIKKDDFKLFSNCFKNITCIQTRFLSSLNLEIKFNDFDLDDLIINSFTIADIRVLKSLLKNKKTNIIYLQHGLYLEYMPRNIFYFLFNIKKSLSYLMYAFDVSKGKNIVKTINVYLKGESRSVISQNFINRVNLNFVFSDYWKEWHTSFYKINSSIESIGYVDSYFFEIQKFKNHIVYCPQTLVEDGRISKKTMMTFYSKLKEISEKLKMNVVVKTHPRNSQWTLDVFKNFDFIIENKKLPIGEFTIGHYSSLLPCWTVHKSKLLVFELPKHDLPESISKIANRIVNFNNCNDFKIEDLNNDQENKCDYYFGRKINIERINFLLKNKT